MDLYMVNWKEILRAPRRKFPGSSYADKSLARRPGYLPPLPTPPVLERLSKDLHDSRVLVREMEMIQLDSDRITKLNKHFLSAMSDAEIEEYQESIEVREALKAMKEKNDAWLVAAKAESDAMAARLDAYRALLNHDGRVVTEKLYRAANKAMMVAEEAAATTHAVAMKLDNKADDLDGYAWLAAVKMNAMVDKANKEADADKAKKKADADKAAVVAWWAADEEKVSPPRSSVGPPPKYSLFGPESDEEKVSTPRSSVGPPPKHSLFGPESDEDVDGGRMKRKTHRRKAKKSNSIHRKKSKGTRKKRRTRKGRR